MTLLVLALLGSLSAQPANWCDTLAARNASSQEWNPLAGEAHVLWFCGPPVAENDPAYVLAVDGVARPSPGRLQRQYWWPPDSASGWVPYVGPGPYVVLTPGPHRLTVTYGDSKAVATFTWIGSTCKPGTPFALGTTVIDCARPERVSKLKGAR